MFPPIGGRRRYRKYQLLGGGIFLNFLFFLNGWRQKILNEDPRRNRDARGAQLGQVIGKLIMIAYHVVVLDTIELPFKLPDFSAICIHLLARARPVFVKLVDDQRGVPVYDEPFDAELNGYTDSVETCFIFDGVVGGQKMYLENVSKLILGRRDE